MGFVQADPHQYLLTGRNGTLVNRGPALSAFLWPGTVWVLVPSNKQEASFAFTQETRDGIPLRFKGVVIYRITDPVSAARAFDFAAGAGTEAISALLTDVVLGELRDAVSHMTMAECIEGRKTNLSEVVRRALSATLEDGATDGWGISIEVAQLSQVFITDADLRAQLEAEVRNEIKLRSDQSDIRTAEEGELTALASRERVAAQKLSADTEGLKRDEALFAAQMAAEQARLADEAPIALERVARERELLGQQAEIIELRRQVRAGEVDHDLLQPRAEAELRRQMLRVEHEPRMVEAASRLFQDANLSIYGSDAKLLGELAPLLELIGSTVRRVADGDPVKPTANGEA